MLLAVHVKFTLKAVSEFVLLQRMGVEMHQAEELQARWESIQSQEYSVSVVSRQKLNHRVARTCCGRYCRALLLVVASYCNCHLATSSSKNALQQPLGTGNLDI